MTTTRRGFGTLAAGAALAALAPAAAASASPRHRRLVAHDDFRHGLGRWAVELEQGGTVTAQRGVLEVDVPAGATIWFRQPLEDRTSWSTPPRPSPRAVPTTGCPT
ncbi:hypothetical protein QF027_008429 [Streptomyces canus]|nr:hypothetical protein [Streptomyces canus]